jgi:hypothetical protein
MITTILLLVLAATLGIITGLLLYPKINNLKQKEKEATKLFINLSEHLNEALKTNLRKELENFKY